MAKKFSLTPSPTFKAVVDIPIPGAACAKVQFVFKHRSKSVLTEWLEVLDPNAPDETLVLDIASGWDLEDAFDEQNIVQLCEAYPGSARAIMDTYLAQSSAGLARLGNFAR